MLLELHPTRQITYLYHLAMDKFPAEYTILQTETYPNIKISTLNYIDIPNPKSNKISLSDLVKNFTCKCGKSLDIKSTQRLPEDGWEELIDLWSCHDSEFKSMLDLKICPKYNSALISHFYMLIKKENQCCFKGTENVSKIFYNEFSVDIDKIIFTFFKIFWEHNNTFLLKIKDVFYEIKYYNPVIIQKTEFYEGFQVGFKKSKRKDWVKGLMNEEFSTAVVNMLERNAFSVEIMGYQMSHIY